MTQRVWVNLEKKLVAGAWISLALDLDFSKADLGRSLYSLVADVLVFLQVTVSAFLDSSKVDLGRSWCSLVAGAWISPMDLRIYLKSDLYL